MKEGWKLEDRDGSVNLISEIDIRLKSCEKTLCDWSAKRFPNNRKVIIDLKRRLTLLKLGKWSSQKAFEVKVLSKEIEEKWRLE